MIPGSIAIDLIWLRPGMMLDIAALSELAKEVAQLIRHVSVTGEYLQQNGVCLLLSFRLINVQALHIHSGDICLTSFPLYMCHQQSILTSYYLKPDSDIVIVMINTAYHLPEE